MSCLTSFFFCECNHSEVKDFNRLAFINSLIQDTTSRIYVIGDMDADISYTSSLFANHMAPFCKENHFLLSSEVLLPHVSYTYISEHSI